MMHMHCRCNWPIEAGSLNTRELIRGGALLAASGAGLAALAPPAAAAPPDGDLAYLRLLVAAELLALDFEAQARASGKAAGRTAALLKQIRADDTAHYAGLGAMLNGAGQPPTTAGDIDFTYPKGSFASQGSILKLGWTLSTLSLGAYLGAVQSVQTSELRGPIGQIAANEAQHVSAFAQLLGRPVVGSAFAGALSIDGVSETLDRYES
jgi:hypothetical protein